MSPSDSRRPPAHRARVTGAARSRTAQGAAPTPTGAPATIWAPPPAAVGDRWRAWLLAAIDRAFLPAGGRRIDLTEHVIADPRRGQQCLDPEWAVAITALVGARPYWAALVGDPRAASAVTMSTAGSPEPVSLTDPVPPTGYPTAKGDAVADLGPADLAVVDLGGADADDRLGVLAARTLRGGGILVVLTHCHHPRRDAHGARHPGGRADDSEDDSVGDGVEGRAGLVDPTGTVVASAQNADLLYLQHIVIPTRPLTAPAAAPGNPDYPREEMAVQPQHGNPVHRWTRHAVAHADLLVFARPHGRIPMVPPDPDTPPPDMSGDAATVELLPADSRSATGRAQS